MRQVTPEVYLVAATNCEYDEMLAYLEEVSEFEFANGPQEHPGLDLIEFGGRLCYRSWQPGLNPNVTKVRHNQKDYLQNILKQGHGSVLEHATCSFVFHNVSRVFTHELVRHRAGTAISQESFRYVRLTNIPIWLPEWAQQDEELVQAVGKAVANLESLQHWMAEHFKLDEPETSFHEKKLKTSFMRRFAPEGTATGILWTANVRTIRHVLESRTSPGAEEEIRLVFNRVGEIMRNVMPSLFEDYSNQDGRWTTDWKKV